MTDSVGEVLTLDDYGNPQGVTRAYAEAAPHPGPWSVNDGWLLPSQGFYNFWQLGIDPQQNGCGAFVEACVDAYAHTIAMLPASHWRRQDNGGRERVETSALSRLLLNPNDYQSGTEFVLNLVRQLYLTGNAYALADRNDRFEVSELHLFDPCRSTADVLPSGAIFYSLGGNYVKEARLRAEADTLRQRGIVPARDVLHLRLDAKSYDPLTGIPPWRYAELAVVAQNALAGQMVAFFQNQSRPSGIISTDALLTTVQLQDLRKLWNEQSRGLNQGETPILSNGLKYQPMSASAKDAEVPAILKQLGDQIFMAYGIPPAVFGLGTTTYASVESLNQSWLSQGLGFALALVEDAISKFFGLRGYPIEYLAFDTSMLLRSAYKDRIEGLTRGITGGLYTPDEARAEESLPKVPGGFGAEARLQAQVVPLSAWDQPSPPMPTAPTAPAAPTTSPPAEDKQPDAPPAKAWREFMLSKATARDDERHSLAA